MAKGQRKRLQARHAGHFFYAVDQQRGTRAAQYENESWRRWRQAEMHGGVHDIDGIFTATNYMLHFAQAGLRNFLCNARKTVDPANFLDGGRRNGKELAADAE